MNAPVVSYLYAPGVAVPLDPQPAKRRRRKVRKLCAPQWPPPATLRPIPWGDPDPKLGALVCRSVEHVMPYTPWQWTPTRTPLPVFTGWLFLAGFIVLTIAGFRSW